MTKINGDLAQEYSKVRYEPLSEKIQGQCRSVLELHEGIHDQKTAFKEKYFADEM